MGGMRIKFTTCYLTAIWRRSNEAFGGHYDSPIGWRSCCDVPSPENRFAPDRPAHFKRRASRRGLGRATEPSGACRSSCDVPRDVCARCSRVTRRSVVAAVKGDLGKCVEAYTAFRGIFKIEPEAVNFVSLMSGSVERDQTWNEVPAGAVGGFERVP